MQRQGEGGDGGKRKRGREREREREKKEIEKEKQKKMRKTRSSADAIEFSRREGENAVLTLFWQRVAVVPHKVEAMLVREPQLALVLALGPRPCRRNVG